MTAEGADSAAAEAAAPAASPTPKKKMGTKLPKKQMSTKLPKKQKPADAPAEDGAAEGGEAAARPEMKKRMSTKLPKKKADQSVGFRPKRAVGFSGPAVEKPKMGERGSSRAQAQGEDDVFKTASQQRVLWATKLEEKAPEPERPRMRKPRKMSTRFGNPKPKPGGGGGGSRAGAQGDDAMFMTAVEADPSALLASLKVGEGEEADEDKDGAEA